MLHFLYSRMSYGTIMELIKGLVLEFSDKLNKNILFENEGIIYWSKSLIREFGDIVTEISTPGQCLIRKRKGCD